MDDSNTVSQAIKLAFAAVNVVVWTGLFAYLMRIAKKIDRLERIEGLNDKNSPQP